jgi:hypothetical protein
VPYATLDDVQKRMPQFLLTAQSKPNLDTAQVLLDDAHAHLDAALSSLGYTVPITGPLSIPQVREAVCDRAICRILHARGAAVGTDAALQSAEVFCARYDKFLEDLADDASPIDLPDAGGDPLKGFNQFGETSFEPRITIASSVKDMDEF